MDNFNCIVNHPRFRSLLPQLNKVHSYYCAFFTVDLFWASSFCLENPLWSLGQKTTTQRPPWTTTPGPRQGRQRQRAPWRIQTRARPTPPAPPSPLAPQAPPSLGTRQTTPPLLSQSHGRGSKSFCPSKFLCHLSKSNKENELNCSLTLMPNNFKLLQLFH